jgi:uncharacterized protein YdeI (YjbR/CyaY-like superfamily)
MKRYHTVDEYILGHPRQQAELELLRSIMVDSEMEETVKWGIPGYKVGGKNVIGLAAFKSYVGIWFHQGVFLKDEAGVLHNAQDGKTKGLRQWRFSSIEEIDIKLISSYVNEAIQNQKDGKEIKFTKTTQVLIPEILQDELSGNNELSVAYNNFTLSKQREFADYISEAKREETKVKRLDKIIPMILDGTGLHDKYKKF